MSPARHFRRAFVDPLARRFCESVRHPLIYGLSVTGSGPADKTMNLRRGAQSEFARKRLFRLFVLLSAKFEVVVNAFMKSLEQFFCRIGFVREDVANTYDTTVKHNVVFIELDRSQISLVGLHSSTPESIRKVLISRTTYAFVSGDGCGRCTRSVIPFKVKRTRDPRPSDTCAPSAISNASTSRHLIEALTGFANILPSVCRCAAFTAFAFPSRIPLWSNPLGLGREPEVILKYDII